MRKIIYLIAGVLTLFAQHSVSDVLLSKGIICGVDFFNRTTEEQNILKAIGATYKSNSITPSLSCLGWAGAGSNWYGLSDKYRVSEFNISTKTYLGNLPITPSSYPCESPFECEAPWYMVRWNKSELLEPEVINRYVSYKTNIQPFYGTTDIPPTLGCLGGNPLKYGDLEGDGKSELVLYIKDSWMIFSPELHHVTFMSMLDVMDWLSAEESVAYYAQMRNTGPLSKPEDAQYTSRVASMMSDYTNELGYRGYAKLYFGHYSEDAANDLIEWRKLYKSRLVKDPIKGFEKISDTYAHYKLINGEYQKQATPEETIKGWLAAKQLTWQKGYPSKSECPGQEGQLIPEMHDPLLNDPDVLQ